MIQNDPQQFETVQERQENRLPRHLRSILCLDDFETAARKHLPGPVFTYYQSAVEDRMTHQENRRVFSDFRFIPRTLIDTGSRSQSVSLFGKTWNHPFGIAPMGLSALGAYDGDVVIARTASELGIPSILSAASLNPLERVADEGNGRWFQTYLPGEMHRIEPMVDRVKKAGYETLVLTVDVPVAGNPENQTRGGFSSPMRPSLGLAWQGISHPRWLFGTALRTLLTRGMPHFDNMDALRGPPILSPNLVRAMGERDRLTWEHVKYIRRHWKGNLIIKGILAAEDVSQARDYGANGVIISNHGGRQLDGAVSSLHALPDCVQAAGDMPVMIDSGFRRGHDVLVAYALGASFVFVGRPFLYAACVAGAEGIRHCANILSSEISRNMAMLGINNIDQSELMTRITTST